MLAIISIIVVLAITLWIVWLRPAGGGYVKLRGELLAVSIHGGPTIYYLHVEGFEHLIRLDFEKMGTLDVGPYIGKQIEVEGYIHEEYGPRQLWMDVRDFKPAGI